MRTTQFILLFIFSSISAVGWAQDTSGRSAFPKVSETINTTKPQMRPHMGLIAGVANPEASFNTSFNWGVDIGFQPLTPMTLALEVSGYQTDRSQGGTPESLDRTTLLAKVAYNLGGDLDLIKHSYFGVGLGPVFDSNSPFNGTHFGVSPLIGFDIPLEQRSERFFTVGLLAKYMFVSGPSPDASSLNGLLKYWF